MAKPYEAQNNQTDAVSDWRGWGGIAHCGQVSNKESPDYKLIFSVQMTTMGLNFYVGTWAKYIPVNIFWYSKVTVLYLDWAGPGPTNEEKVN
jgi:hypothetical protein